MFESILTHLHYYFSLILLFIFFIYIIYDCLFLFGTLHAQRHYMYVFEKKVAKINIVNLLNGCFGFIIAYYIDDIWWKQVFSNLSFVIWSFTNSYFLTMLYYRNNLNFIDFFQSYLYFYN